MIAEPGLNLTVVVPISEMAGRLQFLASWLPSALSHGINVTIVHDIRDDITGRELQSLLQVHQNPLLEIIEGKFGSPGETRNAGMKNIQTSWVAFWDSDDFPYVDNFSLMVNSAIQAGAEIAIGEYVSRSSKTGLQAQNKLDSKHTLHSIIAAVGIWRMAFRVDLVQNHRFIDSLMGEDLIFFVELCPQSREIFFFRFPVYEYQVGSPTSLTNHEQKREFLRESTSHLFEVLKVNPDLENELMAKAFVQLSASSFKGTNLRSKAIKIQELLRCLIQLPIRNRRLVLLFSAKLLHAKLLKGIFNEKI
jgi:glycosyltransferase involved in cell wall biosynthesis